MIEPKDRFDGTFTVLSAVVPRCVHVIKFGSIAATLVSRGLIESTLSWPETAVFNHSVQKHNSNCRDSNKRVIQN